MSARSAQRLLERLLADPEFAAHLYDDAQCRLSWADALREEGYTCSIADLRELTGPIGCDELEPELWLTALVLAAASP